MNTKQRLLKICSEFVQNKRTTTEETITSNKNALNSETKSSAGDKHETGRAMLQLEMEKAGQQLVEVQKMQDQLNRIDLIFKSPNVRLGSIVKTNLGNYFIAISKGQIKINDDVYFVISSQSPIGELLIGKTKNDAVLFRNQQLKIIEIL